MFHLYRNYSYYHYHYHYHYHFIFSFYFQTIVWCFLVAFFSLPIYALSPKDFVNKVVLVEIPDFPSQEKYYDYFAYDKNNDRAFGFTSNYKDVSLALGLCISLKKNKCEANYLQKSSVKEAVSRSLGFLSFEDYFFQSVSDIEIDTISITEIKENTLIIKFRKKINNLLYKLKFKLSLVENLSDKNFSFVLPTIDKERTGNLFDQNAKNNFADKVLQIYRGPKRVNDMLGDSIESGSGFFISSSGLFLTNYHVIASYPECMQKLRCLITYKQIIAEGVVKRFKAYSNILAESKDYDFILLKMEIPSNIDFSFFKIEENNIGANIYTIGYPKYKSDTSNDDLNIKYSKGTLTGFNYRTYATSVYVNHGASGSPMLNDHNNNLIGIVSNISIKKELNANAPALVRPIHIIDRDYQISDYINNKKQDKIDEIIQDLIKTDNIGLAEKIMNKFINENTLYGVDKLLKIIKDHPNEKIEEIIIKGLIKANIIRGYM